MGSPAEQSRLASAAQDAGKRIAQEVAKKTAKTVATSALRIPILIIALILLILISFWGVGVAVVLFGSGSTANSSSLPAGAGAAEIPAEFMPIYLAAEEKYHVPWSLLAAIHRVETVFSTNLVDSSVGATGPMQFMKRTWLGWRYPGSNLGDADVPYEILTDPAMIKKYGGYGVDGDGDGLADPMNIYDAVFSAANYLRANGADEGDFENAVYMYNHDPTYVKQVLDFAALYVSGGMGGDVPATVIDGAAWPLPGGMYITSGMGMRWGKMHKGVDIAGAGDSTGMTIVAFADGVVIDSRVSGGYGNMVLIDHGNGTQTLYGHMLQPGVPAGTEVRAGDPIGLVGNTGNSTGPHLHFEVHINGNVVDPIPYLTKFNPTIQSDSVQD